MLRSRLVQPNSGSSLLNPENPNEASFSSSGSFKSAPKATFKHESVLLLGIPSDTSKGGAASKSFSDHHSVSTTSNKLDHQSSQSKLSSSNIMINYPPSEEPMLNSTLNKQKMNNGNDNNESIEASTDLSFSELTPFIIKSTLVASLGGILFGYDMGVVSGALPQLAVVFDLNANEKEMIVSFLYLGGGFGAAFGGYICDKMGRRYGILLTDLVFLSGALMLAFAPTLSVVLLGRFIVGFGVAVSGIADVSYLHEIAPRKFRGALVSCNEACISLGFLLAYLAAYFLTTREIDENGEPFDDDINGWRYMFGIGGIIAVMQLLGMLFMPESPVWLQEQGRLEEANKVRNLISGATFTPNTHDSPIDFDYDHDDNPLSHTQSQTQTLTPPVAPPSNITIWAHVKPYYRQALIALFLASAQQFCGHTNVLNYAPEIFAQAGLEKTATLMSTLLLGVLKFFVTVFVIVKVESLGRRKLLVFGTSLISFSLFLLIIAFTRIDPNTNDVQYPMLAIIGAMGVVAGYAASFGPLTWLITSELFPTSIRGRALGVSTIVTYIGASLVSYTFLSGQIWFGTRWGPYVVYLLVSLGSLCFAILAVPDTGGRTVDDIQTELTNMWWWRKKHVATITNQQSTTGTIV